MHKITAYTVYVYSVKDDDQKDDKIMNLGTFSTKAEAKEFESNLICEDSTRYDRDKEWFISGNGLRWVYGINEIDEYVFDSVEEYYEHYLYSFDKICFDRMKIEERKKYHA